MLCVGPGERWPLDRDQFPHFFDMAGELYPENIQNAAGAVKRDVVVLIPLIARDL